MAALSFSPSPPPATTTQRNNTSCNNSNSNHSKENTGHQQVKSLGVSKPFQKMTVHNVLSESGANALQQQHFSNQNTIIRKIKDFGMLGTVHNATAATTPTAASATAASATATATSSTTTRKRPLGDAKCNVNGANKTPAATKRTKLSKKSQQQSQQPQSQQQQPQPKPLTLRQQEKLELINRPAGTPGRKGLPLPQAVARRNARERNRVKQVNNGFAALRERIPEEVSEAFEAQGAGRGASKKLSKVETLRMAVEYIRSLERLLGFDFPPLGCSNSNSSSSGDDSFMFIKDEFDGLDEQFDDSLSNYELDAPHLDESHAMATTTMLDANAAEPTEEELLPSVTTLNGLQYVRIPGTSTYQLLTPDMLTASGLGAGSQDSSSLDEEHFNALIATNCLSSSSNGVAAAPAAPSNGECVKFTSTLSRSPVPLTTATATTTTTSPSSSPATTTETRRSSSSLHQPPNDDDDAAAAAAAAAVAVAVAVSPVAVAVANELLLQACAAQQQQQQQLQQQQQQLLQQQRQQQQQQQLIKQEYSEGDFRHVASNNNRNSPPAINNNFQQQQQLLCSPVLPAFYDQEPATSFYDNVVVGLPSFKKEFTDVLHDQSTNTAGGCLSDESMIDAIDWWEAHTPKSDAGTVGGL